MQRSVPQKCKIDEKDPAMQFLKCDGGVDRDCSCSSSALGIGDDEDAGAA